MGAVEVYIHTRYVVCFHEFYFYFISRTTTPNSLREHLKETLTKNLGGSASDIAETIEHIKNDGKEKCNVIVYNILISGCNSISRFFFQKFLILLTLTMKMWNLLLCKEKRLDKEVRSILGRIMYK